MVTKQTYPRRKAAWMKNGPLDTLGMALLYTFVTLTALMMIYPIINIFAISLSDHVGYLKHPWMLTPSGFNLDAYDAVFRTPLIWSSYRNTIIITAAGTFLGLAATILTAYPLSRPETKGKGLIMTILIITMVFDAGIIPNFLNINNLGLYNTFWALILPGCVSAFHCILMINFFRKVEVSLLEAAKIDGASEPFILLRIVIPLSMPVISTIILFKAVGYWNNYFAAQIYLRSRELWPLALLLKETLTRSLQALTQGDMSEVDLSTIPPVMLQYAMLVVSMLPIMCIYPFLQKYFAKGVIVGAVKG